MNYSVLMSVYINEKAEYFRESIDSILTQTIAPSDIVLVCDGELSDELNDAINYYLNEYLDLFNVIRLEKNKGLGLALREGIQHCKYDIVARMDTDDIAFKDRIEKQLNILEKNPNIAVIGGQIAEFRGNIDNIISYRNVPTNFEDIKHWIKKRNPLNHMTVVFRKSVILTVGNYEDCQGFEDYLLWAKVISNNYEISNIEDVCCYVRTDENLYKRRGGIKYFKNTFRLQKKLLELGIISNLQFCMNLVIRFIGTVLVTNKLREKLFKRFLRSKTNKS